MIEQLYVKVQLPDGDVSFSFGVKHSAYLYDGGKLGGSVFRSRSGTYTKA